MDVQSQSALLQQLAVGILRVKQVQYASLAGVTIVALDWLLTFELEVSLVWNSRWNAMKVLYLFTRYLPFVFIPILFYQQFGYVPSQAACVLLYDPGACLIMIAACCAELTLTIRTWAIWGKGKHLTYLLFGAFFLVWVAAFVLLGLYIKNTNQTKSPVPQIVECIILSSAPYLVSFFIVLAAYDATILILMIIQGVRALQFGGDSRLLKVVYRDGIIYYVYLFGLSLLNAVVILTLPRDYVSLLVVLTAVVHSVLACRVVLHIREQARRRPDLESEFEDDPTLQTLECVPGRSQETTTRGVI